MARICFVFLVIAAAVLLVDSTRRRCPKNEQWNDCGSACPPTCWDPNPQVCTEQCIIGCECKPGLLRDENWQCVEKCECSKN